MDSTDLTGERWYRLLAGVVGGVVAGFAGAFVAESVRLDGTNEARAWFVVASLGFGFVLGYWVTAAAYTHLARAAWAAARARHVIPQARLLTRRGRRICDDRGARSPA